MEPKDQEAVLTTELPFTKNTFDTRDIVWAKVRGHAWWPAVVGKEIKRLKLRNEYQYEVHFIGDDSRSKLAAKYLRHFEEAFIECALTAKTRTSLKQSIIKATKRYAANLKPGEFQQRISKKVTELIGDSDDNFDGAKGFKRGRGSRSRARSGRFCNNSAARLNLKQYQKTALLNEIFDKTTVDKYEESAS